MERHNDPEWLEDQYWGEMRSISEIADLTPVSYGTIRRRLKGFGIELRSRGEGLIVKSPGVHYRTLSGGREAWSHETDGDYLTVQVSRLAAVAWLGYDAVAGGDVHHDPNIPWLNVEWAISAFPGNDHDRHHGAAGRDPVWRDPDWLRGNYHGKGLTLEELADKAGCSPSACATWMDRHGIDRRDKWERP